MSVCWKLGICVPTELFRDGYRYITIIKMRHFNEHSDPHFQVYVSDLDVSEYGPRSILHFIFHDNNEYTFYFLAERGESYIDKKSTTASKVGV